MSNQSFEGKVHVIEHPLAQAILTQLRDKKTDQITFRKGVVKAGRLMGYEIIRTMPVRKTKVTTPLNVQADGIVIPDLENIVIVNVLRAAMPLVEGLLKAFPLARQGVMAIQRVEDTVIVADPMLATGSTLAEVIGEVQNFGRPKRTIITSIISCDYGINRVLKSYPRVEIFTLAVDHKLNEHGYIVPGLGDAGDRSFG